MRAGCRVSGDPPRVTNNSEHPGARAAGTPTTGRAPHERVKAPARGNGLVPVSRGRGRPAHFQVRGLSMSASKGAKLLAAMKEMCPVRAGEPTQCRTLVFRSRFLLPVLPDDDGGSLEELVWALVSRFRASRKISTKQSPQVKGGFVIEQRLSAKPGGTIEDYRPAPGWLDNLVGQVTLLLQLCEEAGLLPKQPAPSLLLQDVEPVRVWRAVLDLGDLLSRHQHGITFRGWHHFQAEAISRYLRVLRRCFKQIVREWAGVEPGGKLLPICHSTILLEEDVFEAVVNLDVEDGRDVHLQWPFPSLSADVVDALNASANQLEQAVEREKPRINLAQKAGTPPPMPGGIDPDDDRPKILTFPEHADDFAWVRCTLGEFTFSPNQRPAVKALWADWEKNGLGLGGAHLLAESGGESTELRDLFKGSGAWKTLIVPAGGRRDMFALSLPRVKRTA